MALTLLHDMADVESSHGVFLVYRELVFDGQQHARRIQAIRRPSASGGAHPVLLGFHLSENVIEDVGVFTLRAEEHHLGVFQLSLIHI